LGFKKSLLNQKVSAQGCKSPSIRAAADSELRKRHKQTSSPTLRDKLTETRLASVT